MGSVDDLYTYPGLLASLMTCTVRVPVHVHEFLCNSISVYAYVNENGYVVLSMHRALLIHG